MGRLVAIDTSVSLLANVQTNLTYLQDAIAWLGGRPALAIRPLGTGGKNAQGEPAAAPVTADEIHAIVAQGIPFMPYYNDSRLNGGTPATYDQGQFEAAEAAQQARSVGIPAGTYIPADLEQSASQHNSPAALAAYAQGYADGMRPTEFGGAGGLYGIMEPGSPLADGLIQALSSAKNGNVARMILWPAEWLIGSGGFSLAALNGTVPLPMLPPSRTPNVPPQLAGMVRLWQVSGGDFNDIVDLNVIDPSLLQPGAGLVLPSPPSSGQPVAPGAVPGSIALPATVPAWAEQALRDALSKGVIADPSGGSDFLRALVVMDRLGLLKP